LSSDKVPGDSVQLGNDVPNQSFADSWLASNYWITEAFHSLAPECFERRLYEALNPGCSSCFPKQTDMPKQLKKLSTPILLAWVSLWEKIWGIICEHKLSTSLLAADLQAGTNYCFLQLLKICRWLSRNRLGKQSWEPPPAPRLQLASPGTWGSELAPCEVTLDSIPQPLPAAHHHPHLSSPPPPYRGAGAPERRGEGSRGQSLFLFGSQGLLGEAWRENGCIRAEVGGQDFNSVKEQLVWVSPHVALPSLSPQIQGDEKFVQRGTSKIKKGLQSKALTLTLL